MSEEIRVGPCCTRWGSGDDEHDETCGDRAGSPTAPDPVGEAGVLLDRVRELRKVLWLNHGCDIGALYGDDGEMQCGRCIIDFLRATPEQLVSALQRRGPVAALRTERDRFRTALEQARELSYASRWADLICALEAALVDQP